MVGITKVAVIRGTDDSDGRGHAMYGWIWRMLPGPTPAKLAEALVLLLAVVALLFFVVFPVIEPHLPITQVTVDQ
jgi:hypothetical protein